MFKPGSRHPCRPGDRWSLGRPFADGRASGAWGAVSQLYGPYWGVRYVVIGKAARTSGRRTLPLRAVTRVGT